MSDIHNVKQIIRRGTVTVSPADGVTAEGFEFVNCTYGEGVILACAWAIQELSREMRMMMMERPGDGDIGGA